MKMAASCLNSIKLIWGNLHIAGQLFSYGIFGVILGVVTGVFEFVVDLVGSVIGFVLLIPIFLIEVVLRVIFGKF